MNERKMKKTLIISLMAFLVTAFGVTQVYAAHPRGCSLGKSGYHHRGKESPQLSDKFIKKVHFLKLYQNELELSSDQLQTISDIKYNLKKDMIGKEAEVDVIKLDIYHKLYERTVDVAAINQLIDSKYSVKSQKSKALIQAFADLKNVLTDEQYDEMKEIWRNKKKH